MKEVQEGKKQSVRFEVGAAVDEVEDRAEGAFAGLSVDGEVQRRPEVLSARQTDGHLTLLDQVLQTGQAAVQRCQGNRREPLGSHPHTTTHHRTKIQHKMVVDMN